MIQYRRWTIYRPSIRLILAADTLAGLTVNADYILLVDNDKSFERSLNQALKDTGTKAEVFMGHFS